MLNQKKCKKNHQENLRNGLNPWPCSNFFSVNFNYLSKILYPNIAKITLIGEKGKYTIYSLVNKFM